MSTERRRRRSFLREVAGEGWGLILEVIVVGMVVLAALALAGFVMLVA